MRKFLHKKEWSKNEWRIFNKNINALIKNYGLKRGEFSRRVGVVNFFRDDRKKVSKRIIDNICDEFNVTEDWLCTSENIKISENIKVKLSENKPARIISLLNKIIETKNDNIIQIAIDALEKIAKLADLVERKD